MIELPIRFISLKLNSKTVHIIRYGSLNGDFDAGYNVRDAAV